MIYVIDDVRCRLVSSVHENLMAFKMKNHFIHFFNLCLFTLYLNLLKQYINVDKRAPTSLLNAECSIWHRFDFLLCIPLYLFLMTFFVMSFACANAWAHVLVILCLVPSATPRVTVHDFKSSVVPLHDMGFLWIICNRLFCMTFVYSVAGPLVFGFLAWHENLIMYISFNKSPALVMRTLLSEYK